MKKQYYLFIFVIYAILSCNNKEQNSGIATLATTSYHFPDSGLVKAADSIQYQVVVKNSDAENTWLTETLSGLDRQMVIAFFMQEAKENRAELYDYFSGTKLSYKDIERIITENGGLEQIGNFQFKEKWYIDKANHRMIKEVESIVMGFESFDEDGKIKGYKAGFVIVLKQK